MDGLLIDSEDKYTIIIDTILHEYGKPSLPWSIKAQLQGRPAPEVLYASYPKHAKNRIRPIDTKIFCIRHAKFELTMLAPHRQAKYFTNGRNSQSPMRNSMQSKLHFNDYTFRQQSLCPAWWLYCPISRGQLTAINLSTSPSQHLQSGQISA
jgi:pseudouridine-5'-monophosphatase